MTSREAAENRILKYEFICTRVRLYRRAIEAESLPESTQRILEHAAAAHLAFFEREIEKIWRDLRTCPWPEPAGE